MAWGSWACEQVATVFDSQKKGAEIKKKLDPIAVLAQLALMKYKEPDSRMSYSSDLKVYVQQPSDYQWGVSMLPAVRMIKGQSQHDLDMIEYAIEHAAQWHQPHTNPPYRELFEKAKEGLSSLQKTYEKKCAGLSVTSLKSWDEKITKAISEGVPQQLPLSESMQDIQKLWSLNDIKIANILLEQMKEKQGDTPIDVDVTCKDEIAQLELLINQKQGALSEMWKRNG